MSWCPTNRCARRVPDPIRYIDRTRRWYAALGFDTPYRWAENRDVPFTGLPRPLKNCRIALITTAALYDPEKGEQGPGAAYNGAAKFYRTYRHRIDRRVDTRISHIAYDRDHTSAEDQASWLPLDALRRAEAAGRIGSLARHLHGAPTNRSRRITTDQDAPDILSAVRADGADAAILVPNCPVCHQSVTLIARHLEANGLPTAIMGCALDIVERAGAPRFVFSDFPLGNAAGKPKDARSQDAVLALALELLETVREPRATVENPELWSDDPSWKADYCNPNRLSDAELAERREAFDAQKGAAERSGDERRQSLPSTSDTSR